VKNNCQRSWLILIVLTLSPACFLEVGTSDEVDSDALEPAVTSQALFRVATMKWSDKQVTISHTKYSIFKEVPWTIDPVKCLHDGNDHNFSRSAWRLSNYTPVPIGSAAPKGMTALLTLSLAGLTAAEVQVLQQHFVDRRQLTITVYNNNLLPETLLLNLEP